MKGRANSVFVQEKVMGAEETVHTFTSCGVRAFPKSLSQQISSHDPICCPGTPAVQVQ